MNLIRLIKLWGTKKTNPTFEHSFKIPVTCTFKKLTGMKSKSNQEMKYKIFPPNDKITDDDMEAYYVEVNNSKLCSQLIIIDQFHLGRHINPTNELEYLEVNCQTLYLTKNELSLYSNPKYHSQIQKIDAKIYQVKLTQFTFCDEDIVLNDDFVNLFATNQPKDYIFLQFKSSVLQVILAEDHLITYLSQPPKRIPELLYNYFVNLSFRIEHPVELDCTEISKPSFNEDFYVNINGRSKGDILRAIPNDTPDNQTRNAIFNRCISTYDIKTYNNLQYRRISFVNDSQIYYLSLTEPHLYDKYSLPTTTKIFSSTIVSSMGDEGKIILRTIDKILDRVGEARIILLTNDPKKWTLKYSQLTSTILTGNSCNTIKGINTICHVNDNDNDNDKKYSELSELLKPKLVSDLKTINGPGLYLVKIMNNIKNDMNKCFFMDLENLNLKNTYLVLDHLPEFNKWFLEYPVLHKFDKLCLENPLDSISDDIFFNLEHGQTILKKSDDFRVHFYTSRYNFGLLINKVSTYGLNFQSELLISDAHTIETDESCPICRYSFYLTKLDCGHYICPNCLEKLNKNYQKELELSFLVRYGYIKKDIRCPCCRSVITNMDLQKKASKVNYKFTPEEEDFKNFLKLFVEENIGCLPRYSACLIYLFEFRNNLHKVLWVNNDFRSGNYMSNNSGSSIENYNNKIIKKFAELENPIQIIFSMVSELDKQTNLEGTQLIINTDGCDLTNKYNLDKCNSAILDLVEHVNTLDISADLASKIKPFGSSFKGPLQILY
jgi:hypothetical protein